MRGHGGRDGRWIVCDQSGHCRWVARSSVAAARVRIYEASRGVVPAGARLENVCGDARCVNLDHLRLARASVHAQASDVPLCKRGHALAGANVVTHRDGRVAYCRLCRNDLRRERYRTDRAYADGEVQRRRRRRGAR